MLSDMLYLLRSACSGFRLQIEHNRPLLELNVVGLQNEFSSSLASKNAKLAFPTESWSSEASGNRPG